MVVSYERHLARLRDSYEATVDHKLAQLQTKDTVHACVAPSTESRDRMSGREVLGLLLKTLDSFSMKRSKHQRYFHREMIKSILPHIFRHDLDANLEALKREFFFEDYSQQVMIVTPRRWGKTIAVSMFVAACAIALPAEDKPFVQAIFSTGRRASQKLLEQVHRFLVQIPGVEERIKKHNVEMIWIQGPGGQNDMREIYSYPSKVKVSTNTAHFVRYTPYK